MSLTERLRVKALAVRRPKGYTWKRVSLTGEFLFHVGECNSSVFTEEQSLVLLG